MGMRLVCAMEYTVYSELCPAYYGVYGRVE